MKAPLQLQESARRFSFPFISISLIVLTILIVYWQDLSILANEAVQNEATSHIALVPLLSAFLIYRKKDLVKASLTVEKLKEKIELVSLSEITGIALCLSAFLLYWYGSFTFYPLEYHVASLVMFLIGIALTLFNVKILLALIFPILFMLFLMPPPSALTYSAGTALGSFNAQASYALLKTFGVPVALSSEYGPPTIVVNDLSEGGVAFAVDQACSGIYSLVAFTMFAVFLVYVIRGPIVKRIALLPLGFLMLPILNILRISIIVFIAYRFGEAIATTIFHTFSGWLLVFLGMLLIFLVAERLFHLRIFQYEKKISSCPRCADVTKSNDIFCRDCGKFLRNQRVELDKKFWTKLAALLLASYMVTLSMQAPTFAFAQGLTITTADPEASAYVFPQTSNYKPIFLYRDQNFEKISHQDASLLYAYFPQNASDPIIYVLVGVASSITNLHSWEVCLTTWQQGQGYAETVNVLESKDTQIMQNPPITARYFVFKYPPKDPSLANYTQVTLYWYQKGLFKTGLSIEPRYTRISLIILSQNPNNIPELEQNLLDLGQAIAAYWEPLRVQSLVSLGIPTMQILLASTILVAITLQVTQYAREWRRKTVNLKIFEQLASPYEKSLHQTIKELRQVTKETTTQNAAPMFEKAIGKAVKTDELTEMLKSLEKQGIINSDIMSIQDQPRLVWKP